MSTNEIMFADILVILVSIFKERLKKFNYSANKTLSISISNYINNYHGLKSFITELLF